MSAESQPVMDETEDSDPLQPTTENSAVDNPNPSAAAPPLPELEADGIQQAPQPTETILGIIFKRTNDKAPGFHLLVYTKEELIFHIAPDHEQTKHSSFSLFHTISFKPTTGKVQVGDRLLPQGVDAELITAAPPFDRAPTLNCRFTEILLGRDRKWRKATAKVLNPLDQSNVDRSLVLWSSVTPPDLPQPEKDTTFKFGTFSCFKKINKEALARWHHSTYHLSRHHSDDRKTMKWVIPLEIAHTLAKGDMNAPIYIGDVHPDYTAHTSLRPNFVEHRPSQCHISQNIPTG